jgi:hypothetical protein
MQVGENMAADRVSKDSALLSFDFFDEIGKPIKVENLVEGIDISIPKKTSPSKSHGKLLSGFHIKYIYTHIITNSIIFLPRCCYLRECNGVNA